MAHRSIPAGPGLALACALGLAACGGDDHHPLDGAPFPDAGTGDAALDCYAEADDLGNAVTAEATGLGFGGGHFAICGTFDGGHVVGDLLDLDRYRFTVSPGGPESFRLTAPSGAQLDRILFVVRDRLDREVAVARFRAGHAVAALALPQGEYTVAIEGHATGDGGIAYRLDVAPDDPAVRCPAVTGTPTHTEVDESGAGHRANDMIDIHESPVVVATPTTASDAPDDVGAAVSAGGRVSMAGLSASVASAGDDYHDRDTFALYTGASVNQIDVRTVWTGGPADLDVRIFEAGDLAEPMGTPAQALIGEEVSVTAVRPSTAYWVWVGGSLRSTTLPASYTVYVCGREVSPAPITN